MIEDDGDDSYKMYETARKERQARRAHQHQVNRVLIAASGLQYRDRGETLCFRETGKPCVDFYPSTGRWKIVAGGGRPLFNGGAAAFLAWYRKDRA
jgi:hypothetical protein